MKHYRLSIFLLSLLSLGLFISSGNLVSAEIPKGFKPLFNGKDLTGWKGLVGNPKTRAKMSPEQLAAEQIKADEIMRAHWSVQDGALVFDGKGKSLCTAKDYGDFEMYVDWKILKDGDSGIYLRGSPQIQIWDPTNEKQKKLGVDKGSGALWNNKIHERFPIVKADNPIGEWNTFYIRMVGERLTVKLNGKLVTDNVVMENFWERDKPIYKTGQIELQNHGNTLWFKNIYIREIPTEESNAILNDIHSEGFQSVFNGKDFTGWGGPVDQYEVKAGAIVCKPGKGGHIHTKKEYANFVAKLEFQLPPGGNNGLAIRYPGSGNAHINGMTEIQILDSEHPKYAKLHPTQYHGSVYGLVPAHRGFLRPVGEWNFQTVTVDGSQIIVELNGFTILDADLSQVKKAKDGDVYPNVNRKTGFFGFAGHRDPVAFRNISIKELPASTDDVITPKEGVIKLFNGQNLDGLYTWIRGSEYKDPLKIFTVKDGLLHISGNGFGAAITKKKYRDYHMVIEFKWGEKTWLTRKGKTRDSGVLFHCYGPDGSRSPWMPSIEAQIIEGGVGDILILSAKDAKTGKEYNTWLTTEITKDRDGEKVWKKGGEKVTLKSGRINWWGRDVDWVDKIGFRGKKDVESPHGEWTRMDVICNGGHVLYKVNGVVVNEGFDAKPDEGKLLVQTEGAEMFVRRWELWPLGKAPIYKKDK